MIVPSGARSLLLDLDGITVHYFEAGRRTAPHLVLLHSCEFGAAAEFSWEFNLPALAEHFHVIAPDMLGYGLTAKIYDFGGGPTALRLRIVQRLLKALQIDEADFIGNSCGASFLLQWAAEAGRDYRAVLPIRRMVLVSPSMIGAPGPGRSALNAYDGSREAMRDIVAALFHSPTWPQDDAYVDRRQDSALRPGHWETVAAARFRRPGREASGFDPPPWSRCVAPALFVVGGDDKVVGDADGGLAKVADVPGARFHVMPQSGHCTQIEHPEAFNRIALDYLA